MCIQLSSRKLNINLAPLLNRHCTGVASCDTGLFTRYSFEMNWINFTKNIPQLHWTIRGGKFCTAFRTHQDPFIVDDVCCYSQPRINFVVEFHYLVRLSPYSVHLLFFLQGGKYDAKALLGYCYYGGMIYTALKKFEKALYFFEVVCLLDQ